MNPASTTSTALLKTYFPLQFDNGHRVDTIGFWCKQCSQIAHPDQVYGTVSRLIASAADVRATIDCPCGHLSEYLIRLKDDKSYTYLDEGGWHTESGKQSLKRRVWLNATNRMMNIYLFFKYRKIKRKLLAFKKWLNTVNNL